MGGLESGPAGPARPQDSPGPGARWPEINLRVAPTLALAALRRRLIGIGPSLIGIGPWRQARLAKARCHSESRSSSGVGIVESSGG